MAGLATVQLGYDDPAAVYTVNVVGTANVLQAVRESDSVRAVVGVTSDKCYLDQGSEWAYREDDRLGGYDPYSSSKAAQELVIAAFRDSILAAPDPGGERAGRQRDRRRRRDAAAGSSPTSSAPALAGEPIEVRAPHARRPWQHVLNPLEGYLLLAERLADDPTFADRLQLRPATRSRARSSGSSSGCARAWPGGLDVRYAERPPPHEAAIPSVDSTRARTRLGWRPPWDLAPRST